MSDPLIRLDVTDGVAQLTLNRPDKRNALTREMLADLLARLKEVSSRPDLRCLVLTASGPLFCAGMDLGQMQEAAGKPDAAQVWHADTQLYHDVVKTLFDLPAPTLAVVRGGAIAGGLGLILACDIVVAGALSNFALPEPKRGITAAVVTPLLVHRTGPGAAGYVLLSGATIDVQEAQRMGICHIIADEDRFDMTVTDLLRSILSGAPGALAITKKQLRACGAAGFSALLAQAAVVSAQARETPEAREGLAAFLERRQPGWCPK
ncbi:MAG: enoyl-CoA hydratase/isomerase family protein [Planctomycetia bacterium]|nr:enoyl-CoA hydratase/isomerase family protein [Planctomycetia bacterium]